MQSIQSAVLQAEHTGHEMLRYQCHFVFLGKISLCSAERIIKREEWEFKGDNLIVPGGQFSEKLVELDVEGFAVRMSEKIVASDFNQDQTVACRNVRGLIKRRFNGCARFCKIDYF